ncbi:MAG TPA: hypothetical protein PKK06_16995 [Phycisphaerae bacterium]|nr:hypothetical protein [Phycisphaerae bacterium]HNU46229.1 hypothetical protein [Phycisphaerae bacterium]
MGLFGPTTPKTAALSFFDWLTRRRKPLSRMTRAELRRQELLLDKDRTQLLNRISKLAKEKQELFERGAGEKTPEVRRVLAQEFEMRTTEQLMLGRQLNIRSKELMTVSRLRMLRETAERAGHRGRLGLVSEADMLRLGKLIESDAVRTEVYQERLDEILALGREVDEGSAGLTAAGQTVLDVWEKMDRGAITDREEGFEEADRRVRERQAAAEG